MCPTSPACTTRSPNTARMVKPKYGLVRTTVHLSTATIASSNIRFHIYVQSPSVLSVPGHPPLPSPLSLSGRCPRDKRPFRAQNTPSVHLRPNLVPFRHLFPDFFFSSVPRHTSPGPFLPSEYCSLRGTYKIFKQVTPSIVS